MSGDSTSQDIEIPSVFMLKEDGERLREIVASSDGEEVFVLLTWIRTEEEEEAGTEGVGQFSDRGQSSDSRSRTESTKQSSPPSHSSPDNNNNNNSNL